MSYEDGNISLVRANTASTAYDAGVVTQNTSDAYANLFYPHILDNGGNSEIVSLTIDIFNIDELEDATLDLPDKSWVTPDRMRNNLLNSREIWGFREAFNGKKKSRAMSNGFCFGGQELSLYVKPQGHGTGQISNEWVYCNTSLEVVVTDVINGTRSVIHTFDSFESDSNDDSRFFNWTVPSQNDDAFVNYGLFGMQVISLEVTKTYYKNAEKTVLFDGASPNTSQAYLQLLTYSGATEIIEVDAGDLDILTSLPSYDDSLEEVFDNTIFEALSSTNLNGLSESQKRAMMADQIAVLFISQHPVITADFYPSSVIGSGGKTAVEPTKIVGRAITYARRYPDLVPMVKDRLFGIFATYEAFNYVEDIEEFFSDFTQSSQVIRDPVRTIFMDEDGVVSQGLGVDGLIFDPFAMSVVNADIPKYSDAIFTTTLPLFNELVDIENIAITDTSGGDIDPYSDTAMVSFDVVYGDNAISQIRYSLTSENSLNYAEYIDEDGLSRSHVFVFDGLILNDPTENGDVLRAQIDIIDVEGNVTSFVANEFAQPYVEAPSLYDLRIYQRSDGSNVVDIFYTYDGLGEVNDSFVYIQFSLDGATWSDVSINSLKGDYGDDVMPGRRRVTWEPSVDLADVDNGTPVQCRITLYDADSNQAIGNTLTGILVWDIEKPSIAVRRLSIEEDKELEMSSSSSSSSSSS